MQALDKSPNLQHIFVDPHAVIMRVHAGKNAGATRVTQRRGDIAVGEGDALIDQSCIHARHEFYRIVALIVANDDQKIWPARTLSMAPGDYMAVKSQTGKQKNEN